MFKIILLLLYFGSGLLFLTYLIEDSLVLLVAVLHAISFILLVRGIRIRWKVNMLIAWFVGVVIFDLVVFGITTFRVYGLASGGEATLLYFFAIPYAFIANSISLIESVVSTKYHIPKNPS